MPRRHTALTLRYAIFTPAFRLMCCSCLYRRAYAHHCVARMQSLCLSLGSIVCKLTDTDQELVVLSLRLASQLSVDPFPCCCFAISDKAVYIVLH